MCVPFSSMVREIKAAAAELYPAVVALRQKIHQYPELAFEEHETARLVQSTLSPLGLGLETGIAKTGVVATLKGGRPGPTVLLRADMDALPIQEETGVRYASSRDGVMHACGHDVHTASLLGAAMILHRLRAHIAGTVRMVFQPSEELLPGGAKPMIEAGILRARTGLAAPAAAFAQHVWHALPVGTIGIRSGMFMASSDEVYITVHGQGGHAAEPHRLASDPVLAAAHVIVALQSVISRHCNPEMPSVLSIGSVSAAGATNVIPDTVHLAGTLRAMGEAWRSQAHAFIQRVATGTATAYGTQATVEIRKGYPALHNDPGAAALTRSAAVEFAGSDHVVDIDRWYASEDFAYFLRTVPGAFYLIGAGCPHMIHTSRFLAADATLRTSTGFMAYLAWRFLAKREDRIPL